MAGGASSAAEKKKLRKRVQHPRSNYPSIMKYLLTSLSLVFVSIVISWMISIGLFDKSISSVVTWIKRTSFPNFGLYTVSFLLASILWLLLTSAQEIKIETSVFSIAVKLLQTTKPLFSFPIPLLVFFVISSGFLLFLIRPQCEAPVIGIEADISGVRSKVDPKSSLIVESGSLITIRAYSLVEHEGIRCKWTALGDIFQKQLPNSNCINSVSLTDTLGSGIVTVEVSKDWCEARSVIPIIVTTQ